MFCGGVVDTIRPDVGECTVSDPDFLDLVAGTSHNEAVHATGMPRLTLLVRINRAW